MKTKKAAAKRFRFTATGKVKFNHAGRRHLLSKKSNEAMLGGRSGAYMTEGDARHVRKCMPYGE